MDGNLHNIALEAVKPLLQEQRDRAYDDARRRIIGEKPIKEEEPKLELFEKNGLKFPPELMKWMHRLFYVILVPAFIPSAIRIFLAVFALTVMTIPSIEIAVLIGAMSVLLAESGQVAFTLWASLSQNRLERFPLYLAALACTLFALVANATIVKPSIDHFDLLIWIDAFLPPVLVLIAANVRKAEILNASSERYAAHQAYTEAHQNWKTGYKNAVRNWEIALKEAEKSPAWERTLANSLRDSLRRANRDKNALRDLNALDWVALVMRERKAEEWWDQAHRQIEVSERKPQTLPAPVIRPIKPLPEIRSTNGNSTGEVVNAEIKIVEGGLVKVCPVCQREFFGEDKRTATNRLVAHMKSHVNERKELALHSNGKK